MPGLSQFSTRTSRLHAITKQSHFILLFCILSLLAIASAKFIYLPFNLLLPSKTVFLYLLFNILIFVKRPKLGRILLLIFCPLVLFINSSNFLSSLKVYGDLYGKNVEFVATVQDDAAYNIYGDYEFNVTDIHFAKDGSFLPGRVRIRSKQNEAVYRGDRVLISGKLKPALGSRTGSISYATLEIIESKPSWLERIRLRFFSSINSALPEPHASLGIGFIAGVRSSIPKEFQDELSRVGLTHIIAVSGYNLTILVLAISKLGKRLSKYQRLVISLVLIMTFLLITGFSPSVVRAAVVCVISLACGFFGRKISPLNLILISAIITAGFNPVYLWEDIGWWLSFLAFFGVLILAPALTGLFSKNKDLGIIAAIIIESLSAQIMTAPLIAHVFGTLSVISLIANILVIPWIPFIMLLILIVGSLGIYSTSLAAYLSVVPRIVLTCIIMIIEKLSNLSWASLPLKISQAGMLLLYLAIGTFIILTRLKITRKTSSIEQNSTN